MLPIAQQQQLKKMLIFEEGKRNKIYKDIMGNETVGIGHLCSNGFSDAIIDQIFNEDWIQCYNFLLKSFAWFDGLDQVRVFALLNMVFNLGPDRFSKFKKFLDAMSRKQYQNASQDILCSLWSNQLPERTKRIAYMILHGEFPSEYGL